MKIVTRNTIGRELMLLKDKFRMSGFLHDTCFAVSI